MPVPGKHTMTIWFLYLIQCNDGSLYTGITTDVKRRLEEHQGNSSKGSKYLRGKTPLQLVFKKKIGNKSLALKIEHKIKKLSKPEKELLIEKKLTIQEIKKQICLNTKNKKPVK